MINTDTIDQAIAESNAYEVIRSRLEKQGKQLEALTAQLNQNRLHEFQSIGMEVLSRLRVRTENNCIARDIVRVGEYLLFGYNVFIGLKTETRVEDVFTLYQLQEDHGQYDLQAVPMAESFLAHPSFVSDFRELYTYYKQTRLTQLRVKDGKLLAAFQIGERITDLRVFRWALDNQGKLTYIDNRGERDIALPRPQDFEWQPTGREHIINGRHPHLNILDTVFVETIGGDLTIKVENNTSTGLGIYSEAVADKTQSLDDAKIFYAAVGQLILLKVLPYREEQWRYLVFNRITQTVSRIDAIGLSCIQLPEDHGLIFPGGIYLQNGELRHFEEDVTGMRFKRTIRSPNGEDVLYLFYEPIEGKVALFAYNLIEKDLKSPLFGHGYALMPDGRMVIFNAESDEPTRIHPMQIWQTPFMSEEYASQQLVSDSFYARIGNAELVRGISELYSVVRGIQTATISTTHYNQLIQNTRRLPDTYYWLGHNELAEINSTLQAIVATAELVLDEFEKVESIRAQAQEAMQAAEAKQKKILSSILPDSWDDVEDYIDALTRIRRQRGHLMTIRDYRYIDQQRIDTLDAQLLQAQDELGDTTVKFLASEKALQPYQAKLNTLEKELQAADTLTKLQEGLQAQEKMAADLDLLSELMATLKVEDSQVRIKVTDDIASLYARLNQLRARTQHRKQDLGRAEAVARFSVQFKLFSQSVTHALSLASTPEKCDEQLSRLLVQMEELESQFSGHDEFLADIIAKREEVYESFEAHKQALVSERQRRAQNLMDAAQRILTSIQRRTSKFTQLEALNTFYASDALVVKVRDIAKQLRELDDSVKADDLESNLKNAKEQAIRSLRDKQDIYEEGGNTIKLGPTHRFSVTTQALDLSLLPRGDHQYIHLSGTDFFEKVDLPALNELRDFWEQNLVSETAQFYRAEYLAGQIMAAAEQGSDELSWDTLNKALETPQALLELVRQFAAPRYKEGYEKGIHDHDAAQILASLLPVKQKADLLRFDPLARGLAITFWAERQSSHTPSNWPERAQAAAELRRVLADNAAFEELRNEVVNAMEGFFNSSFAEKELGRVSSDALQRAATYLLEELARPEVSFVTSHYAYYLVDELRRTLSTNNAQARFDAALEKLADQPAQRWQYLHAWLQALVKGKEHHWAHYIPEAVALLSTRESLARHKLDVSLEMRVADLMGEHPLIHSDGKTRSLYLSLDQFLSRYQQHSQQVVPAYQRYLQTRSKLIEQQRERLRLDEFKPKPLASFVRNKLLNEVYLPLIGDNLAKQMGTVGDAKRTDLMGMLMLISPPGYGKTTLMEYVADRLGLIFMKINCPSLGYKVVSLDPAQAPDATSAQELQKLNLALEMGNNVMLYLDDIQHTNPEFLQKFVSLADGTRRIEGIWQGRTRTYDMRGKRFCIIMAGNPYTESGELFKIPDMLANRADIYNLGEVLGDKQAIFALSYLENCLTSNAVLAPLATRDLQDTYTLIELAQGREASSSDLSYRYSGAELNEIVEVFKRLITVQAVVLKVNQQYIASAAQSDEYRTEPPFKLQGSYRNMNKMAEKVSAIMNEQELMQMIADHYQGEAQLLTSGAEENLLKLAELRGNMTAAQKERWNAIKQDYRRNRLAHKADVQVGQEIAVKLGEISEHFHFSGQSQQELQIRLHENLTGFNQRLDSISKALQDNRSNEALTQQLLMISDNLQTVGKVLHHVLSEPRLENVLSPSLAAISTALQQLHDSLEGVRVQSVVVEKLEQIAKGVQLMGQELSEVSDVSSKKLNWLTGVKKKL